MSKERLLLILATLLALFLGALDALIISAAIASIVAELGGFHLYSWVFSAYMLSRAVSLPIFGKLADLFPNRTLYAIAIVIFVAGSVLAGMANGMLQLTLARAVQGIGAGGVFALTYIVLADIAAPGKRGRMMSIASFVWGLASVLGPTMGGFIVTYTSWRWIFFINIPLGGLSLAGVLLFLRETRDKRRNAPIDYAGAGLLTTAILCLLTAFLMAGREYPWVSIPIIGLFSAALVAGAAFVRVEKRAREPVLPVDFFAVRGFRLGNAAAFFASVAIFCLVAYAPLFIQGALGKTPMELGMAMLSLSLGWSVGALGCGQLVDRVGHRPPSLAGAVFFVAGTGMAVTFDTDTSLMACAIALGLAGLGMGFVSIATLILVQQSIESRHLGIATASHQFTRTLAGTIGIGVCGSLVTPRFIDNVRAALGPETRQSISQDLWSMIRSNVENIFRPEIQSRLSEDVLGAVQSAIGDSVDIVFWFTLGASALTLLFCWMLPARKIGSAAERGIDNRAQMAEKRILMLSRFILD